MPCDRSLARASTILASLLAATPAARAEDAIATTSLNVRSGPGASYAVVDVLAANERVTMSECQTSGWCYVTHDGPDGWVSATYLAPVPGAAGGGGPDCRLLIEIGTGGSPTFRFECGGIGGGTGSEPATEPAAEPEPEAEAPPDDTPGACFWRNANYGGQTFCAEVGIITALAAPFNDSLSSVRLYGGAKVVLCEDTDLNGHCRTLDADTPVLGPLINNRASSLQVYTGLIPPVEMIPVEPLPEAVAEPPVTLSTGPIELPQSYRVDLDTGTVGGGGADLWFHAVAAGERYLEPVNGAMLALGNGSNRGRDGCRDAAFSTDRIRFRQALEGSYVCVRTGQGHIAQFRVNGIEGTTLKLGYTTWAN